MSIADALQRQQAIDVTQSFIVQAPAGSGKTELLTQRFLNLLTVVNHPEEIIAITFTKKAASEMRNRILHALERAAYQPEPSEEHALKTWTIAKKVLDHSNAKNWGILENPNRLRVQTIDSFCASLTKQMPLMARLGSPANIINDAEELYEEAAINLLATLEQDEPWANDLSKLLLHLDNNIERCNELFIDMLKNRNQWLPHIVTSRNQTALRTHLEDNLQKIITDAISKVEQFLPNAIKGELLTLLNFSRENLQLSPWDTWPSKQFDHINDWKYLATTLLTNDLTWRKVIDKRNGFPTDAETKEQKLLFKSYKQQMQSLLVEFSENTDLQFALEKVLTCPPANYSEKQWSILENLLNLLPVLTAQLQLIFEKTGKIDFIALTDAALQALGETDNPTDLALYLDYKIQHLLIDEFQDTSATQYRLIERLTEGWYPNDGRSLFLVGDPMQSIYSFRAAEVGLFLRAQQQGIGQISLTPLKLEVNFRSTLSIVNWINDNFRTIFPKDSDITSGAVNFSPAVAYHNSPSQTQIASYLHTHHETTEADTIVDLIKTAPAESTIAILVKAKNQLASIIPRLQQAKIPYQALELEKLSNLSIIQDLLALSAALHHFSDRIAWLSILRAPWCALTLNSLHIISQQHSTLTIWDSINNPHITEKLSTTDQKQLQHFLMVMHSIMHERGRMRITAWLYSAWLQLGGPASAKNSTELESATAFFELVQELETTEQFTIARLKNKTEKLFAKPNPKANVQLMTIHKAKGLEFDIVILPSLEKGQQYDPTKLLLWLEQPRYDDTPELLLAPIKAKAYANDAIYDYVKRQHNIKQQYEASRLLYVATTRAKKQLYLLSTIDTAEEKEFKPLANSFLEKLWPTYEKTLITSHAKNTTVIPETKHEKNILQLQQPLKTTLPFFQHNIHFNGGNRPQLSDRIHRAIGTLSHELLYHMGQHPIEKWLALLQPMSGWLAKAQQLMINDSDKVETTLRTIVDKCTHSNHARWILQQPLALSEYKLTAYINDSLQNIIIDRMFIENDICWIIDYKTSEPSPEQSETDFLNQEKQSYLSQLNNYARIIKLTESRTIHLGLYFPLCDKWISWDYTEEEISDASYL